jgi:hypothetical protein
MRSPFWAKGITIAGFLFFGSLFARTCFDLLFRLEVLGEIKTSRGEVSRKFFSRGYYLTISFENNSGELRNPNIKVSKEVWKRVSVGGQFVVRYNTLRPAIVFPLEGDLSLRGFIVNLFLSFSLTCVFLFTIFFSFLVKREKTFRIT